MFFFVSLLAQTNKGLLELIMVIKRVILLKSGPAYKKIAIENQSGPMIPSGLWLCLVLRVMAAGRTLPALYCTLPGTPAVLKVFCLKL